MHGPGLPAPKLRRKHGAYITMDARWLDNNPQTPWRKLLPVILTLVHKYPYQWANRKLQHTTIYSGPRYIRPLDRVIHRAIKQGYIKRTHKPGPPINRKLLRNPTGYNRTGNRGHGCKRTLQLTPKAYMLCPELQPTTSTM